MNNDNSTNCLYFSVMPFQVTDTVRWSSAFAITLNSIFAVVAVFSNSAVILAVLKCKGLRTTGNLLIGSLSITDLLVGTVVQPLCIAFQVLTVTDSTVHCWVVVAYTVMRVLCTILSQMTVLLISLEKSLAIFWPFRYRQFVSKRRVLLAVAALWCLWAVVVSSRFMGLPTKAFRITVSTVIITSQVITGLTYIRIERLAATHIKHIKHQLRSVSNDASNQAPWKAKYIWERKALRTTLYIMACLFVCYAPLVCILLVNIVTKVPPVHSHIMFTWADTFVYLNSSINPAIYCLRNREFRRGIASLVRREQIDNRLAEQQTQNTSVATGLEMSIAGVTTHSPVLLRVRNLVSSA